MVRGTNIVFGIILVLLGIEALWADFISNEVLSGLVFLMGVAILWTKISLSPTGFGGHVGAPGHPKEGYQFLRRWIFGAILVIMGLGYFYDPTGDWLSPILVDTLIGGLILIVFGVIYWLAASKRARNIQIGGI